MKPFILDNNISLQGEELFDEIYEAFKQGLQTGMEEYNYLMIKKLYNLNIDLNLIAELTDTPIDLVACIIAEKDLI